MEFINQLNLQGMKTFDELFQEAAQISDRRSKVLNQLIEQVKTDILPAFCKACDGYDLNKVYIKTDHKAYSDSDRQSDERDYFFGVCIDVQDETISDARFDCYDEKWFVPLPQGWKGEQIKGATFLRVGIVEFVKALNSRLEKYNTKYSARLQEAEKLLK